MSEFIQIHSLTAYPPSNVNRDDMGRPKSAIIGGVPRLRISSQCLKRTWRISDVFQSTLSGNIGTRTKLLGVEVFNQLKKNGISETKAKEWAQSIAGVFGKLKTEKDAEMEIEQLVHVSPQERESITLLTDKITKENRAPIEEELSLLRKDIQAADIALFGRMLASSPEHNMDAAVQVSHAFSVSGYSDEDDYFTAVDDLGSIKSDKGSAHIGEAGFGSGIFYLYTCINKSLLLENLQNDMNLSNRSIKALGEAMLTIAPSGKQNSFASRVRASFALAEKGTQQPRSMVAAFFKPISGEDQILSAIKTLIDQRAKMDKVYGKSYSSEYCFNAQEGTGSFDDFINFIAG
jgi:CRISPR system Cascade subunit CasC